MFNIATVFCEEYDIRCDEIWHSLDGGAVPRVDAAWRNGFQHLNSLLKMSVTLSRHWVNESHGTSFCSPSHGLSV